MPEFVDPDSIDSAVRKIAESEPTDVPHVSTVRTLLDAFGSPPWTIGPYTIEDVEIAEGEPRHGEKRSDDHISRYEIVYPLSESNEHGVGRLCPECGDERAIYEYRAFHYISVQWSVICSRCGHNYDSEVT